MGLYIALRAFTYLAQAQGFVPARNFRVDVWINSLSSIDKIIIKLHLPGKVRLIFNYMRMLNLRKIHMPMIQTNFQALKPCVIMRIPSSEIKHLEENFITMCGS